MSLHDTIEELKAAAKRLDAAMFNPDMSALQKFADGLDVKGLSATPPEDVRQKALEKFLRGSDDFTNRELRALPFIIYEAAITLDGVKKILRKLNFFKASHLRGLVNVYLTCCDRSAKTELLRQRLQFMPQEMAGNSRRLQKIFAAREFLFGDNRLANTAKLFANSQSIDGSLEVLGLSNFFKVSNFIHDALKNFFRSNAPLSAQMKILAELNADYNAYQNIFPAVADALIQTVDRADTDTDKKTCMEIFYHRLGDPRFGFTRFNWDNVSDKSREIFCHWLSENDLETFFNIVAATSNDAQWSYREKFWRQYLLLITNTWIFLTGNARRYAAFFPRNGLSAAVWAKLQMLAFDETAQISDGGILLPFEKSFGLSEENAELLSLPPHNPYRISIRTEAYIGVKDFRYVVDFPDAAATTTINGALLHVGEEIFRFNAKEFALINLVELGNKNFQPQLLTLKQIQLHAAKVDAQLDGYYRRRQN